MPGTYVGVPAKLGPGKNGGYENDNALMVEASTMMTDHHLD